ncbi:nuclear protein MDM1 isoform X3 [Oryzias melastigma]|uniref:nuclear protein MDM1 isoform X3 n=1 Tax=Oryzias melastigma TaxID=30732 RepID=UPI000CF7CD10|nr:nuclear protein MDM1 isoform X3 [Oryzias melastigma]
MTVRFKVNSRCYCELKQQSQTEYQRSFTLPRSSTASALPVDPPAGSDPTRNTFSAKVLRSSAHRNQQKPPTGPAGRPESAPEPPAGPRPPADPRPSKRPGLEPAADGESDKPRPFQPRPNTPVPAAAASAPPSAMKVDHVMRLRAESKAAGHRSGWQKPLTAASPLLTAEQGFYPGSRSVSPYRRKPVSMETEYGRSFQGLIPPSGPRLRKHLDHEWEPLFHTHTVNRRSREEEPTGKLRLHQDTCQGEKDTPPPRGRRMLTEYQSSFPSALLRKLEGKLAGAALQVTELRQRALMYRRRAWGANFSRDHLGQLLSDQNALWEPSDASGSVADARVPPLAMGPSPDSRSASCVDALDLASVSSRSRSGASEPKTARTQRRVHAEDERRSDEEEDQLSPSRLKTRTPSDLGTPATGGAVLVGKQRNADVSHPQKFQRNVSVVSMATEEGTPSDLPVKRKEAWSEKVFAHQHKPCCSPSPKPSTQVSSLAPPPAPPPLHAIQGSMRHPDFQHNGELGVRLRETSCSGGSGGHEEDRLSVMSWRSAASRSAASVVLERAQKRHKNFWGKH